MDFLEFDKHIKKTMSSERAEVDINQLLTDLDLRKPNKTRLWIPFLLLGVSMIIGFGLFKLQKNPMQGQTSELDIISSTQTISESQNSINKSQLSNSNGIASIQSINNSISNSETNLETVSTASSSASAVKKPNSNIDNASNNNHSLRINSTNIKSSLNKNIDHSTIALNEVNESSTSFANVELANQSSENSINNSSLSTSYQSLSINLLNRIVPDLAPLNNKPFFKLQPQDCPSFREKRWFFALVPEVSYDIQMKTLSTTSPEYLDLVNERNANESTLEGYSLGLSAMMYHKKGMYFKFGMSYSAFTERMDFSRTYTEMDTTQGIISITESQSGDTLTVIYGDIIINREVMETTRAHYRFSMIDIPFSAGMSYDFNSFGIDVEAGVLFNIRTTNSGRVLASDLSFTDLGSQPLFKTSLGIGYFGAIYLRKDIHPKGSIIFGPKYRVRPQHFNTDQNPIKQQYKTLGFHLGYIHRF